MRRNLFLLLLAIAANCVAAAPDEPVARPQVKPGDRWTYRHVDYWTNQVKSTFDIEVTFANDKAIQAVQKQGSGREIDATWTAEWNAATRPDRCGWASPTTPPSRCCARTAAPGRCATSER